MEDVTSLGANRWQAFRHVLLPLILSGVISASVFAFTLGITEVPSSLAQATRRPSPS